MPQVWAVISFFLLQVFQDLQAENVSSRLTLLCTYLSENEMTTVLFNPIINSLKFKCL